MIKLGITGGLGSGKTTAARFFASKGAVVFDADHESKEHLRQSKALQKKLIGIFGERVTSSGHKLDFTALAQVAFSSPVDQKILNGIMWPEVFLLVDRAMKEAARKKTSLFVVDAALLIEAQYIHLFDKLLVITAPRHIRLQRARERAGLTEKQILKRMDLQLPDSEKVKYADFVVENNGTPEEFTAKLEEVYSAVTG